MAVTAAGAAERQDVRMPSRLDDLLDAAIVLAALGLHVGAALLADAFPPSGTFEVVIIALPMVVQVVALVLLLVRRDRRGLAVACLLEWLLVLYVLPAGWLGLSFIPAAAVLTLALYRPRRVSSDPAATG